MTRVLAFLAAIAPLWCQRFPENPLISVATSKSVGDNVNGPSVIRVPPWIEHPLGRYYMYFAHHKGTYIRLAYADSLNGPWRIYEPGVLKVGDTIFSRPQPDPPNSPTFTRTSLRRKYLLMNRTIGLSCMFTECGPTESAGPTILRPRPDGRATTATRSTRRPPFRATASILNRGRESY